MWPPFHLANYDRHYICSSHPPQERLDSLKWMLPSLPLHLPLFAPPALSRPHSFTPFPPLTEYPARPLTIILLFLLLFQVTYLHIRTARVQSRSSPHPRSHLPPSSPCLSSTIFHHLSHPGMGIHEYSLPLHAHWDSTNARACEITITKC